MLRAPLIVTLAAGLCLSGLGLAAPAHASAPADLPPTRPEPAKGKGLYGAGIFGVSFGIFNIGYGIPLSITAPGHAYFSGYIPIAFGASFIALGAVGIHYGRRRRAVWKAWHEDPTAPLLVFERPPTPTYVPWLIVGGVLAPIGLGTIALMIPELSDPILNTPRFAYWVAGWGAVTAAAGAAMLAVGTARYSRSRRARQAKLELAPTGWARRDGLGLGLVGRF